MRGYETPTALGLNPFAMGPPEPARPHEDAGRDYTRRRPSRPPRADRDGRGLHAPGPGTPGAILKNLEAVEPRLPDRREILCARHRVRHAAAIVINQYQGPFLHDVRDPAPRPRP